MREVRLNWIRELHPYFVAALGCANILEQRRGVLRADKFKFCFRHAWIHLSLPTTDRVHVVGDSAGGEPDRTIHVVS